jgi:hypothetical protein
MELLETIKGRGSIRRYQATAIAEDNGLPTSI